MARKRRSRNQRGAVMLEFLYAIIPFMLLFTGVIQLALISVAKLAVHYAAAAAARAAVVVIPDEEERIIDRKGMQQIKNAAVFAILPLVPASGGKKTIVDGFAAGGGWKEADKLTGVLLEQGRLGIDTWDAQITTRVVFAYHCNIPLASAFFCSPVGELPDEAVKDLNRAHITPGAGRYLILRAQHTLTKQGRPNPMLNPRT